MILLIFNSAKNQIDLLGLGTFAKYGSEILLGFIPRQVLSIARIAGKTCEDMPNKLLASTKSNLEMKNLITETYKQLSSDLVKSHKDYYSKEKKFEKDKLLHGTLTEQKQAELDNAKKLFERLQSTIISLAECINEEVPILEVGFITHLRIK